MKFYSVLFILSLFIFCTFSSPRKSRKNNFIGDGTNELAIALLQGYVQQEQNLVFSPTAYSIILAIISEGARGETQNEIRRALHFPEDITTARQEYHDTIQGLTKAIDHGPQFKNWFYVYKNYTVEEEFENVLRTHYLTEVKKIDRPSDAENEDEDYEKRKKPIEPDQKPLIVDPEKTASELAQKGVIPDKIDAEEAPSHNAAMFDGKPDEKKEQMKEKEPSTTTSTTSEPETTQTNEQDDSSKEIMIAMQRRVQRSKKWKEMSDHAGMTDSSLKIHGNGKRSQMILFNGLHFYGEWGFPFTKVAKDDTRVFYKSGTEKVSVPTIHAEGEFNSGPVPNLESTVLELPYKVDERYSLLVLIPDVGNTVSKLISDLSGYSVMQLYQHVSKKQMEICLPVFELNTISKPISSLSKLGMSKVTKVFNPEEADLTGISPEKGLFVEELVQFVSFDVDNEKSEVSQITASSAASRTEYEKLAVNRPFLFFLVNRENGMIIVAGKVMDPSEKDNLYWKKKN